jgi:DHA1 family bicyclomycin/chloramphenicol resistance-like MFS transporter
VSGAIAFASLFSYISSSPGVFMQFYGLTQKQYGLLFAFLASGLILASQLNSWLLKKFSSDRLILIALIVQNLFGVLFFLASLFSLTSFWTIIVLLFFYLSSIGLIMPNATALAMQPFEKNAGSASALLGFIQMGLGSVATIFIGLLNIKDVLPMAVCMLVCSIIGLLLILWSASFLKKGEVKAVPVVPSLH